MSGDTTSDEEGSQEDSPRYDVDDLEMIKTIGEPIKSSSVRCLLGELSILASKKALDRSTRCSRTRVSSYPQGI